MDHPRPGLRYVSVHDLGDGQQSFEDFVVQDPSGDKLGMLEGFVLNVNSAQPYYAVVDGGGWFSSKHFLVPIGHVTMDRESHRLVADVTKAHVKRFPGFDLDEFKKMSEDDLYRMSQQIAAACCPDQVMDAGAPYAARFEIWSHYRTPTWWDARYYDPSRETHDTLHRG